MLVTYVGIRSEGLPEEYNDRVRPGKSGPKPVLLCPGDILTDIQVDQS